MMLAMSSGCASQNAVPVTGSPQTDQSPVPISPISVSPSPNSGQPQGAGRPQGVAPTVPSANSRQPQGTTAFRPDANDPRILRDFETTAPLPETGKLTIRADISTLEPNRLLVDCPTDTAPYAYAESSNYRIQVCSAEYDPWLPKYYIGRAKDGGNELRLVNKNVNEAKQLIFRNGDYIYSLSRDGARAEQLNAYLEIYSPDDQKTYAEALVYFYERLDRP